MKVYKHDPMPSASIFLSCHTYRVIGKSSYDICCSATSFTLSATTYDVTIRDCLKTHSVVLNYLFIFTSQYEEKNNATPSS